MRIKKYEDGGIYAIPVEFVPGIYSAPSIAETSTKVTQKKSGDEDKEEWGLLDKDARKVLIEKALPSDLQDFERHMPEFLESMKDPITGDLIGFDTTSKMKLVLYLNLMATNKLNKEEALKYAESHGLLGEIAIRTDGSYLVWGLDGQIHNVNLIVKGMRPLTNQEILDLREYNYSYRFRNDLIDTVKNGASMDDITKSALEVVKEIGYTTDTKNAYTTKQQAMLVKSLQELIGGGPDGYYKIGTSSKTSGERGAYALNWIINLLKPNQVALLRARAAASQVNPSLLLGQLIASSLDVGTSIDPQFDSSATNFELSKKKEEKDTAREQSYEELLMQGYGPQEKFELNPGTNQSMIATGTKGVVTLNNTPMPVGAKLSTFSLNTLNGAFDWRNVSMGGVRISSLAFNNVALTNGGEFYTMYLPASTNGVIKPTVGQMLIQQKAEQTCKQKGYDDSKDLEKINAVYTSLDLPPKYVVKNNTWVINEAAYKKFAVLSGVAYQTAFMNDDGSLVEDTKLDGTVRKLSGKLADSAKTYLDSDKNGEKATEPSMWDNLMELQFGSSVYQGSIYIPMNSNPFTAGAIAGNKYTPKEALETKSRYDLQERLKDYLSSGNLSQFE